MLSSPLELPTPDQASQARSDRLRETIIQEINRAGPMPFRRYMELALYEPRLGYYRGPSNIFGQQGDFVTAPELGPLFGSCIANTVAEVLLQLDGGRVLEFGAGSGALCIAVLQALDRLNSLPDQYAILELSGTLRQRQEEAIQDAIPELQDRVIWLQELPENFRGIMLANEVLDAMPVERFRSGSSPMRSCISLQDGHLAESWHPAEGQILEHINSLGITHAGIYEFNPQLSGWIHSLASALEAGIMLLVDYGHNRQDYYAQQGSEGTLMCHFQHRAHNNALLWPGLQDITAHVDFTAVALSAAQAGLDVSGYTTQAWYLLNAGITELMQSLSEPGMPDFYDLSRQVQQLTLPTEMGERFKVMCLSRNLLDERLPGFQQKDYRVRL